ncbi:centrosomal protein CEP57L1 isoform X3 [Alexandromys fortis]|uniref:centrosomal protein CEP57L1 isoform X3 n=1 Tax=Alexandromys fortis TaxID=100897 RepID=UPI00215358AB|nr:centrosomal protein CEP57L1 isoform X3 [Microtus fortis]
MLPTPAVCDRNYNPQMPPQHFRSLSANQRFRRPGLTGNVRLTMDSELSHSVIGSYHNPPERMCPPLLIKNETPQIGHPVNSEVIPPKMINSPNNQALVSALKTLQEKIHRIELERTQAEDNLNSLSREAAQYKKALENESNERNLAHQELIKQKKDISIQLSSAQSRCVLLEKQLEYTKRMVLNVEREKAMILEQQAQLQREKEQDQMKLYAKLEKLTVLEKECFRLTATQQAAEEKINYLEEKLKEEEHQRKLFQDRACELQTGLEISRLLMPTVSRSQHCKGKKKPPKKTKCLKREPPQQMDPKCRAQSLEKVKMIGAYGLRSLQRPAPITELQCRYKPLRTTSQAKAVAPNPGEPVPVCDSLSDLLMAMQEELDQMTVEHRELMRQTRSHSVSDDIEHELEQLVKKMESKEDQISKLKKHQDSVRKLQQKAQNSRINEPSGIHREDGNPKGLKNVKNSPRKCWDETNPFQKHNTCPPAHVHNVQVKLRKDDIRSLWKLVHIFGTLTFLFSGTTRKLMSSAEMEIETIQKAARKGKA